jgi:hypothetical protein
MRAEFILNGILRGYKKDCIITLQVDCENTPVEMYWARRLHDGGISPVKEEKKDTKKNDKKEEV